MKYMLMGLDPQKEWQRLLPAERERRAQSRQQRIRQLVVARGVTAGEPLALTSVELAPASEAVTLRFLHGEGVATDGPFAAETKYALTGFDVIDFTSRHEAVAFAKTCADHAEHMTEIRPIHDSWWTYHGPGHTDASRFMIMIIDDVAATWSDAEIERNVTHHQGIGMEYAVQKGMVRGEPLCFSSARLRPQSEAVTVRAQGQPFASDGPFAETKEAIAGFVIIDCAGRDEAIAWGRKLSANSHETLEIRPVQTMWSIYHG
jgi:hypothetical protein